MNIKPLLVSTTDIQGGAARAAYRLHEGLQCIGIPSEMAVQHKFSDDPSVTAPGGTVSRVADRLRKRAAHLMLRLQKVQDRALRSFNVLPSGWGRYLNGHDADVVNLHWVGHEMISVREIGNLHKPLVWTLHDMWAFSGTEHYDDLQQPDRFRTGYHASTRNPTHEGIDLDRWAWQRKYKHWSSQDMTIVTPSQWLAECARSSVLFAGKRVEVIPYGLNTSIYKPFERAVARRVFNLPPDKPLILFGAVGSTSDPRKGFHLLVEALRHLVSMNEENPGAGRPAPELVVFGASQPPESIDLGMKARYVGPLHDDQTLALLYAAADVFVAPSMQDNLPNTLLESFACGTPVVAFSIGGIPDIITHQESGYLADAYDAKELAHGIHWVLDDRERLDRLSAQARTKALDAYTLERQARAYRDLFRDVAEA